MPVPGWLQRLLGSAQSATARTRERSEETEESPPDLHELERELEEPDDADTRVRVHEAEQVVLQAKPGDTIVLRLLAPCPQKIHAQIDTAFARRFRHLEGVRTLVLGHDQSIELVRGQTPTGSTQP